MDVSVCDTSQGLEHKMKKRKLEQCDDAPEDSSMDGVHSEVFLTDNTRSEMYPTPDAMLTICSKLDTETGLSHLENFNSERAVLQEMEQNNNDELSTKKDVEHEIGNDSRNLVLSKSNVGEFEAKYDTEMERPSLVNTNEDSRISENSSNIKGHDDPTTVDVAQELSEETIDGRNNKDTIHQCTEKSSGADYCLQCDDQGGEIDSSLKCSYIDQPNGSLGNDASEKIMKYSVEEGSVCCSISDDGTSTSKTLVTLTACCKPSEVENAETGKEVACSSAYGESSNDNVAIVKENTLSRTSDTPQKGNSSGCSRKKLLILDVNGLLADFICYVPCGYQPDIIIGSKSVFKRPFCDDFLKFCFERFEVGVWSSRTRRNVDMVISFLMRDFKQKLLFCWDQSHCTDTSFNTVENMHKPLVLKELRKLWKFLKPVGEYNASNTLLLDDSPHKALCNPANTAIFPITYRFRDTEDTSLGPGGDLRVYLEGLSMAENVQKYVEQNPFGQRAITEKNLSWKFYRRIIYFVERGNDEEEFAAASSYCKW